MPLSLCVHPELETKLWRLRPEPEPSLLELYAYTDKVNILKSNVDFLTSSLNVLGVCRRLC